MRIKVFSALYGGWGGGGYLSTRFQALVYRLRRWPNIEPTLSE